MDNNFYYNYSVIRLFITSEPFFYFKIGVNLFKGVKFFLFSKLLGHLGLEPRTIRLKAEYSTIELVTLTVVLYKIMLDFTIYKPKI